VLCGVQGPTSSGKTSLVAHLAAQTGHEFVRINNHQGTDLQVHVTSLAMHAVTDKSCPKISSTDGGLQACCALVCHQLSLSSRLCMHPCIRLYIILCGGPTTTSCSGTDASKQNLTYTLRAHMCCKSCTEAL
jgi:hypothetical protein